MPLGRTKSNFNYNLDEKRVLNFENIVNDDDNIKQDISIDVYGRAEKEESAEETAPADKQVSDMLGSPQLTSFLLLPAHQYTATDWIDAQSSPLGATDARTCKDLVQQSTSGGV